MARPANYTEKFYRLEKAAIKMGEVSDCAVKAVAILGDLSYGDAHCLLKLAGREKCGVTYIHQTRQALEYLGLDTKDQTKLWRDTRGGRTVRTLARAMKGRTGTWLVWTSQHIFAAKDGEIHDWTAGRLHRILKVSQVTPATARTTR